MGTSKILNHKRRKLSSSKSVPVASTVASSSVVNKLNVPLNCVSCHRRLLSAFSRMPQVVFCARCASPTCAVCSRTCTTRLPSPPSPSSLAMLPRPAETAQATFRRSALSLNSANTNSTFSGHVSGPSRKRRKSEDGSEKEERDEHEEVIDLSNDEAGCGRLVCKKCCFEVNHSNSTTCYDCCGSGC